MSQPDALPTILQAVMRHQPHVLGDDHYPQWHLAPVCGLLNDPNGFIYFAGRYHLFYQWNPLACDHRYKGWGHWSSEDLLHWRHEPIALLPEQEYDRNGCYSGSAVDNDGELTLCYTGNVKFGDGGRTAWQCLATQNPDGTFSKKGPVLALPEGYSGHVRDPKVWRHGDRWYMVLGARDLADRGKVLLFSSFDLKQWINHGEIAGSGLNGLSDGGYMWECPDCFTLDGVRFLSFSPQGVDAQDWKYNNIYQSGYCRLEGDLYGDYELKPFREFDHGFDFYAPQTYLDQQGRRILIGWMGMPDCDYGYPEREYGWTNLLTIPRVLHQRDGRIFQEPLPELQKLRGEELHMTVQDSAEQKTDFVYEAENTAGEEMEVQFGTDGRITWKDGFLSLAFGESGQNRPLRRVPLEKLENLRIFCDTSSIELFANDGEAVFTSRFYADAAASQLTVLSAQAEVTLWKLHPIQIENCFSNKEA